MDALNPRYPSKLSAGDRVAVLSPSSAGPALFPAPYELGLRRLRERFELEPVEYPTTRMLGASPQDRAADIHAAFNDPSIKAVLTSIGGDDQLKVLRHLDPDVLTRNPKPFVGYSDNTNLLHYLWRLGIVGYHGPTVMVELGRPGRMHPLTEESLRRALFTSGPFDLPQVTEGTDEPQTDWNDSATLRDEPALAQVTTWQWHGPRRRVEGRSWGGCLEIIDYHLRANRYLGPPEDFAGGVLFFETSEQMPTATYVYEVLMGMGERGMLEQFPAILVGRPKAWSRQQPNTEKAKRRYREEQREAVLRAVTEYDAEAVIVFDVDFGHTDPQVVLPYGGNITVDAAGQRLTVEY